MKEKKTITKKHFRRRIVPYALLAPSMLLYLMFCYYPFIKSVFLSFTITDTRGNPKKWVGIANFVRLFKSNIFWQEVGNTFQFALIVGLGTLAVAMLLSLISVRKTRFCRVYQTMYALPMAVASVAASTAFRMLFKSDGLVNQVTGMSTNWLLQTDTAMWAVSIATIWLSIGASFIFLLVGFRNVPLDLIESAKIDGAGALHRIRSVLIPCASPQIFFVIFLNINNSFKSFAQIRLLTGGGPGNATMTLIYQIYLSAMSNGRFETACAQAMLLCAIIVIFQRIQFRLEDKLVVY